MEKESNNLQTIKELLKEECVNTPELCMFIDVIQKEDPNASCKTQLNKEGALAFIESKKNISLSLDEAKDCYQISLALSNHKDCFYFMDQYQDAVYNFFLEIALHINETYYFELLISHIEEWKQNLGTDIQSILIAIMLLKKDDTTKWERLVHRIKRDFVNVETVKNSDLVTKDEDMLIALFNEEIEIIKSHRCANKLSEIGSETEDIELARATLEYIRDDRKDLSDKVLKNIARLTAESDVEKEYTEEDETYKLLRTKDISAIKKLIDETDEELAKNMITEDTYDQTIMKIALAICAQYPIYAFSLQEKLHENLGEVLDLQSLVSYALCKVDIEEGLRYLDKIEVEVFKACTIFDIVTETDNKMLLQGLLKSTDSMEYAPAKYEALYALQEKLPISFERMHAVTSQMLPYEFMKFDVDAKAEYYIEKYMK